MTGPAATPGRPRSKDAWMTRRPWLPAAAAAGLFGLGWLLVGLAPRGAARKTARSSPPPDAATRPAQRPRAAEPDLSFGEFMKILGAEAEKPASAPAAQALTKAFLEQPKLRAVYEDFTRREGRGERPSAKSFLAAVRSKPAFRGLLSRLSASPGSRTALASI
ncbi:MAG: hypothetical protein HY553_05820, partial [Elusimicrobia bacterium]|nr:hypothetical protein [Elusimicrobiota bacterium]